MEYKRRYNKHDFWSKSNVLKILLDEHSIQKAREKKQNKPKENLKRRNKRTDINEIENISK